MSYTLYGANGWGSAAVEAALTLTGAPFQVLDAIPPGPRGEPPGAAFAELSAKNPLGQLPTLILPDGTVMTESAAILAHLGLVHPDSGLLPSDPIARARVLRGLVFVTANCYAAIGIIDYPERWLADPTDAAQDNLRQGARKRLHALWETFADTFPAQPWLSGDRIGALDLLAGVVSRWSGARKHLEQHRPALFDHLKRVEAHPAVADVFRKHWP
jgi:GST-like protein